MGSPRHAPNRRRRTREGPEPACVHKPLVYGGGTRRWEKDELTSCRGTVKSAWQKPPVRRKGEELGCPKKGKWSPRRRDSSHLSQKCAQVTGNGQHSGEMGGSSAWTRPSAPECGDTLKALAGDQRPILGGDRPRRRLWGRHRLGHRPVVLLRTETVQCTVRPT